MARTKGASRFGFGAWLRNNFFAGIVVITPIAVTALLMITLLNFVDNQVDQIVRFLDAMLPGSGINPIYREYAVIPGLSVLLAILAITLIGVFARNILGRSLLRIGEGLVDRVPLVRSIYGPIKQILETIFRDQSEAFQDVALVEYPMEGSWALCFVTAAAVGEVAKHLDGPHIGVFIPTTPNPTSGYLLFVPRHKVKILDISVEDGAKLIISAGIVPEKGAAVVGDVVSEAVVAAAAAAATVAHEVAHDHPRRPSARPQESDGAGPVEQTKKDT